MNDGNSETPTGDAAEEFLKQQGENRDQETSINPEIAQAMAKRLAEMERRIAEILQQPTVYKDSSLIFSHDSSGNFKCILEHQGIGGEGPSPIWFGNIIEPYAEMLGTNPDYQLDLFIHTDPKTKDEYKRQKRRGEKELEKASTTYYFDEEGNYAKVSFLPPTISDSRPSLWKTEPSGSAKPVRSEMTPGDFELAQTALHLLLSYLEEKNTPQKPQE